MREDEQLLEEQEMNQEPNNNEGQERNQESNINGGQNVYPQGNSGENQSTRQQNGQNSAIKQATDYATNMAKQKLQREVSAQAKKATGKATKKAAELGAKATKAAVEAGTKLLAKLAALLGPYLPWILGGVILIVLAVAFWGNIVEVVENIKEAFSTAIENIVDFFTLDGNTYTVSDEQLDKLIKNLEEGENAIRLEDYDLEKEDIKSFLEANLITQTVDGYNIGYKKGAIQVWMTNPDDVSEGLTGSKKLEFVSYDKFQEEVSDKNPDCLSHYTVDKSNNILVVAQNRHIEVENGTTIEDEISYSIKSFGYKTVTSQYNIPIMFFIDMAMITSNKYYVLDLADQTKDTQIVITMQNVRTQSYTKSKREVSHTHTDEEGNTTEEKESITVETTDITHNLTPTITKADTLLYTKEMVYANSTTTDSTDSSTTTKNEYKPGIEKDPYIKIDEFEKTAKSYIYISKVPYNSMIYPRDEAYNSLITGGDMLFELMDENMENETLEQMLKYILYKISGNDFGVTTVPELTIKSNFSSVGPLVGSTIAEKVWCTLKDLGYSDIAAAGALGNLHYESGGLNPAIVEGGYNENNGGIGLAQWTNNNRGPKGRNSNLKAYAASKGTTWQDENTQIEYLRGELTKGGGADGYASYALYVSSTMYDGIKHSPSEWIDAKDVETSTRIFCYIFERPGAKYAKSSMSQRVAYAQSYYDQFNGKTSADFVTTSGSREDYVKAEKVKAAGYTFPHYLQANYGYRTYGRNPKTIASSGCGPTSMSMIVAGLTGDEGVNPDSFVSALESYFPNYASYYSYGVGSVYEGICNNGLLQKYYNLKSTMYPSSAQAIAALAQGKCAIARIKGHVLAVVPVPDELKAQGYAFYIMDSGTGLDGPYKSIEDFNRASRAINRDVITFKAIIEPM